MDKNELKQLVGQAIDRVQDKLISIGKDIWEHPEPGYEEFRTAQIVAEEFKKLALPCRTQLARTGVRADLQTANDGPVIAVLGELDALVMPENPDADPVTHAAHACGHNMQITGLLGAAIGLASVPEVKEELSGKIAFIACPAEECRITSFEGIKYLGGKAELIRLGVFDDVQMAFMTHANANFGAAETSNGFVMKKVTFHGKAGHCGRPWDGCNALSAARLALSAVDMQRDLCQDQDCVRIHGIIQKGGSVVNIVPEEVELEYQLRAMSTEAIRSTSAMFDRCMRGAATAFDLGVTIRTYAGYMPLYNEPELLDIHRQNVAVQHPEVTFGNFGRRTSSTDMGDVSQIMPAIHPYGGRWSGIGHHQSFHWTDEVESFVNPAKVMAMNVIDLLYGDAAAARKIAQIKPNMTKAEYLAFLDSFNTEEHFNCK